MPVGNVSHVLTVTITQNSCCIHRSEEAHSISSVVDGLTTYAVDVKDVQVKPGGIQLNISLAFRATMLRIPISMPASAPTTINLSDQYLSVTFPSVNPNLLLGIEYSFE